MPKPLAIWIFPIQDHRLRRALNLKVMNLSPEDVAQYLRTHPEFFEEYAEMLAEIQVPDPHGGRAIPIGERHTG